MASLKCAIKKELIDYYDSIKFDIEIRAQQLLITQEMSLERDALLNLNVQLVEKVKIIAQKGLMIFIEIKLIVYL
jgi:hypothetical protein